MGKVEIQINVQNWEDLALLATGKRKRAARAVEAQAFVDTGAVKAVSTPLLLVALTEK